MPENACNGILKICPGMRGLNEYEMSIWFKTKLGASGSVLGIGVPVPTLPHPELVQVSQFEFWVVPDPFTPEPEPLVLIGLHTWTDAPVGFQSAPVISWNAKYVTDNKLVVGDAPPEPGSADAAGVEDPSIE
jgi:hypothetical protein